MGVSKESISKFLIGNRFHVKLRILSPYSNIIIRVIRVLIQIELSEFYYPSYTYFLFLILLQKSAKHVLFFISKGILDQISIALCFIILVPEFERAFGKANCRSLSERLLHVKHSQSGTNSALQCLQFIHLGLGGKLTLHCCSSSHIFRTEKAFQHIKLTHLRMHFASGSLLFKYK